MKNIGPFTAPKKAALPEVKNKKWPKNEIDYFVLQAIRRKKIFNPNEEADKERLLKRVSFDLTGLPPTPEQTDAFLNDNSPNAYEKTVDELLSNLLTVNEWH